MGEEPTHTTCREMEADSSLVGRGGSCKVELC